MSTEHGPLAPDLYELLAEKFGHVKISNPGEALKANAVVDPATGRINWDIVNAGETYWVNCPFCNDTKQRLNVSYCYGQIDERTMRAATWLAHCFNEECTARHTPFGLENRAELEDLIYGLVNREDRLGKYKVLPGYVEPAKLTEVTLPGKVVTLDNLAAHHPAVQYIEGRGVDAAALGRKLGVGYCVESDMQYPSARGRIIIPIVMDGKLVGWQGRYVGDLDWKSSRTPKYYNLPRMAKKLMLYNVDNARHGRIVVVVESVASVWTLGDASVAILGHDLSPPQADLLDRHWAKKGSLLVFILDPDAEDKAKKHFEKLANAFTTYAGGQAFRVKMDAGKDPGDYDREAAWEKIYVAGDQHGIDVASYID